LLQQSAAPAPVPEPTFFAQAAPVADEPVADEPVADEPVVFVTAPEPPPLPATPEVITPPAIAAPHPTLIDRLLGGLDLGRGARRELAQQIALSSLYLELLFFSLTSCVRLARLVK